jgi:hypothetical protein
VGSTGLMRRQVEVFGEPHAAAQAIDLNVDREHRSVAPALKLQRAVTDELRERRVDLIYGFANSQSVALLRRAGYRPLGELPRWIKPLRPGPWLKTRQRPGVAWKLAARLGLPLARWASPETYRYRIGSSRIGLVESFDARFDELWNAARPQFPIAGERTAAYLRWRFDKCPDGPYHTLGLTDAQGRLAAYVVYRRREGVAYVADFLFRSPASLSRLLAGFLRRMRRERVEAVAAFCFAPDEVRRTLRHFGFWLRPSGLNTLVHSDAERLGADRSQLLAPDHWFLTGADLDVDVF